MKHAKPRLMLALLALGTAASTCLGLSVTINQDVGTIAISSLALR